MTRPRLAGLAGVLALAGVAPAAWGAGEVAPAPLLLLPIDNLTGAPAPVDAIEDEIASRLAAAGIPVVDREARDEFLSRHRIRWTGGLARAAGTALAEETGASGALVMNLDLYQEDPPRIGFTMRLVRAEAGEMAVVWTASQARTGVDAPGVLDLNIVGDPLTLEARALDEACTDLLSFLAGAAAAPIENPRRRFRPRVFHAVPGAGMQGSRVAVLPFVNDTAHRFAGEVMANRLVVTLARGGIRVVEPGEVRQALIDARLIQGDGLDFAQAELLRDLLGADWVVTGRVFQLSDPLDPDGLPLVDFTTTGIDTHRRQVGWVGFSTAQGAPRVRFFGVGMIRSANRLADELLRGLVREAVRAGSGNGPAAEESAPNPSIMMSGPDRNSRARPPREDPR